MVELDIANDDGLSKRHGAGFSAVGRMGKSGPPKGVLKVKLGITTGG